MYIIRKGLNDTNSSINGMNDTGSIGDEGSSNSTEQNIPTSAPQSSSISANKELDQTNNTETTQEKEGLSSGATAGIVIAVLAILLLVLAAFLIHRREQDNQASSEVVDEEAGLDLDDSACRDGSNRGGATDLRHVEPSSPTRSVAKGCQ